MLGAIAGDMIGSIFEGSGIKSREIPFFTPNCRFTDDTVLTVAVAECLLDGGDYATTFHDYFERYPQAGFGSSFIRWAAHRETEPYNSWGNGSAMRVSPVGWAFDTLDEVLAEARRSAAVTHNHPEGIKGAQATAACVFLARVGQTREEIQEHVERSFGYDLSTPLAKLRPEYSFDVSCQGSVPQSIRAFLEAESFDEAVRNAISLGGDADTMACIAGAIAEPFFGGVPAEIEERVWELLDAPITKVVRRFREKYLRTRR